METVSGQQILDAIAEFTNSITNYNTKFDAGLSKHFSSTSNTDVVNVYLPGFTSKENEGKVIYITKCGSCHGTLAGRPGKIEGNNGLYMVYPDKGIAKTPGGTPRFKVPFLSTMTDEKVVADIKFSDPFIR
ncbi:MAG: hypothetical protein IPO92_17045 [Saprospiraceae bacterium]|nr:hypothetical protein [Saprospiraceae bacterium]